MLQVSHLTKIYKTKGGANVKALDDVSVSFPETGMVFLLGKSGSGKSTLLNVCGGLDSPTEGEIIVKGRSSKDFSQSDFDSYRNTFIGFIFQEYNILNEFSVEDNIALALELQGKPKDKKAIAALLEEVDLTGYAKRKPNTLSGGQKQRIAIARALVKAPEIIMADEPTGALDSATGKQVFDTLKKLSKQKLVLVVSHDRDFAEQYGDRIIELKDGQIISDVSKTQEEQRSVSGNVTVVGSTICVKSGSQLTERDFDEIKAFLRGVSGDVMIASGEKDVKNFREVSRITDDGQKEVFRDTDESAIVTKSYTPAESKFIRSKLPMRHAMKIGVSGLKTKPVRLFFTILLCTVAFVLFGLFSTLTFYDSEATFKQSFIDSNLSTVRLVKQYKVQNISYHNGVENGEYYSHYDAAFTKAEVDGYTEQFGADSFGALRVNASFHIQQRSAYWFGELRYLATLTETNSLRSKITGTYPAADDEIMLTSYTADALVECQATDANGELLALTKREELIGKTLSVNNQAYKVTGILDTGTLPSKFDPIRDQKEYNWSLEMEFESELQDGLYMVAFLSENALLNVAKTIPGDNYDNNYYNRCIDMATSKGEDGNFIYNGWGNAFYFPISSLSSPAYYFSDGITKPTEAQAVVDANTLYYIFYNSLNAQHDQAISERDNVLMDLDEWIKDHNYVYDAWRQDKESKEEQFQYWTLSELTYAWEKGDESSIPDESDPTLYGLYEDWKDLYAAFTEKQQVADKYLDPLNLVYALQNGFEWTEDKESPLTVERRIEIIHTLLTFFEGENIELEVGIQLINNQDQSSVGDPSRYTVVGVTNLGVTDWYDSMVYLTDDKANELWNAQKGSYEYYNEYFTNYVPVEGAYYSTIFLPYDHSESKTALMYGVYENASFDEFDTRIRLSSSLVENIETIDSLIKELSKVFLWLGIVLAVFAALLLSNFISVSISHKKREIGILRAVGARGADVFKIFFSESFVITLICAAISILGTLALCQVLNAQIGASVGASIFNFGIFSLAALLAIAILTAVVATFLPVWNAARKKPVDSIRAL